MPKVTKTCRVCGKEYTTCANPYFNGNIFRWQEVACSIECGNEYLRRIMESRSQKSEDEQVIREEADKPNVIAEHENEEFDAYDDNFGADSEE